MVYADNAATTKMSRTAIDAMLPYMETHYGNPSSLYRLGQEAAEALQSARETVAACLGCTPREITFTSGGKSGIYGHRHGGTVPRQCQVLRG